MTGAEDQGARVRRADGCDLRQLCPPVGRLSRLLSGDVHLIADVQAEEAMRRETAFYLLGWMSESGDAGLSYEYLLHTPGGGFGQDNAGGYSNPEIDGWLEEAARRVEPIGRKRLLVAVAERVQEDVSVVPLYRQNDVYAIASGLEFEPRLDRRIRGARMRWR